VTRSKREGELLSPLDRNLLAWLAASIEGGLSASFIEENRDRLTSVLRRIGEPTAEDLRNRTRALELYLVQQCGMTPQDAGMVGLVAEQRPNGPTGDARTWPDGTPKKSPPDLAEMSPDEIAKLSPDAIVRICRRAAKAKLSPADLRNLRDRAGELSRTKPRAKR
jgi:hypothetical protein